MHEHMGVSVFLVFSVVFFLLFVYLSYSSLLGPGSGIVIRVGLLSRCVSVDVGFKTLALAAWKSVFH